MTGLLRAIQLLLGTLMLAAVAVNFSNVVGRYAFSKPIFWAEEAIVFLLIWCVLVGAALVSISGAHLRMDAFEHFAPPQIRRCFERCIDLMTIGVGTTLAVVSARIVIGMVESDQRTIALEIPMALAYAALPIGFALIAAVGTVRIIMTWRYAGLLPKDVSQADLKE
jgi:TRAP-type C4-dicarboxylate transport system permease small subunit